MPKFIYVMTFLLQLLEDHLNSSFMTNIHLLLVAVEDEVRVVLVDRIIRQMHTHILQIGIRGRNVLLSREPNQPILVHEDPHWLTSSQEDINS